MISYFSTFGLTAPLAPTILIVGGAIAGLKTGRCIKRECMNEKDDDCLNVVQMRGVKANGKWIHILGGPRADGIPCTFPAGPLLEEVS